MVRSRLAFIAPAAALAAGAMLLAPGAASQGGRIDFSAVPPFGQSGTLRGNVSGVSTDRVNLYIFRFAPDHGWMSGIGCAPVPVAANGEFALELLDIMERYATRFSAYLVPKDIPVACAPLMEALPFIVEGNAMASRSVPRLPDARVLRFGGLDWYVKTAPVRVGPGPQFFAADNAFLDGQGRLHLRLSRCSDSWCAAEVFTKDRVGYGTYTLTLDSPLNNLDPNLTLGFFTWDELATRHYHREWDIEFARWGNPLAGSNAQYVVQPWNGSSNLYRFLMGAASPSRHDVTWTSSQVRFASYAGTAAHPSQLITQWNFNGGETPVPSLGDTRLHINFYVGAGGAPAIPAEREIIISGVQYTPSGPDIGVAAVTQSVGFLAATGTVNISAGSAACNATVESDSPWLTVTGPNPVTAGTGLRFSVSDNQGGPRTGNLILRSETCNLALGRQVVTVTQAGLICDASFGESSTPVGFLAGLRSVVVRATAPSCTWSVVSAAPWLRIVSSAAGTGTGEVQVSYDAHEGQELRQGALFLHNGREHRFLQDASGSMMALSPAAGLRCAGPDPRFALAWITPEPQVELQAGSQLLGRYAGNGTADLTGVADGAVIHLVSRASGRTLASARVAVREGDCASGRIAAAGVVNAASSSSLSIPAGGLASAYGTNLAASTQQASGASYPELLGGIDVTLSGLRCPISWVSPTQVNFIVPDFIPAGRHLLRVGTAGAEVLVTRTAPGIFTANGRGTGVPVGTAVSVLEDGSRFESNLFACQSGGCGALAVPLRERTRELYLVLYGTGVRNLSSASATVGPVAAEVVYAGPTSQFPGVDQINLLLRNTESLRGSQALRLRVNDTEANAVEVLFQ